MKNNFRLFNRIFSRAICGNVKWTNTYIPNKK